MVERLFFSWKSFTMEKFSRNKNSNDYEQEILDKISTITNNYFTLFIDYFWSNFRGPIAEFISRILEIFARFMAFFGLYIRISWFQSKCDTNVFLLTFSERLMIDRIILSALNKHCWKWRGNSMKIKTKIWTTPAIGNYCYRKILLFVWKRLAIENRWSFESKNHNSRFLEGVGGIA